MHRSTWLRLAFIVAFCSAAMADELRVDVQTDVEDCLKSARLVAMSSESERREVALRPESRSYRVTLPNGSSSSRISVESAGCWSEVLSWTREDPREATIRLYRAATIQSQFDGGPNRSPQSVRAQLFLRDQASDGVPVTIEFNSSCAVTNNSWRCTVPANVSFDARIDVPGYASLYYWDELVRAGEVHPLEPSILSPGGSLSGLVHAPDGKVLSNVRVTILPMASTSTVERKNLAEQRSVRTTKRGFFQFTGLAPGQYRLVSQAAGFSPVVLSDVAIRDNDELKLSRPLRHTALSELEIFLDPPTDSHGRPWRVELKEANTLYPWDRPAFIRRPASESGQWTARGLRAELHEIVVRNEAGALVHRNQVDLFGGGAKSIALTIRPVMVSGVVRAGDVALDADLQLANGRGEIVRVSTDDSGRFATPLPAAGTWTPTIFYPKGESAARIAAEAFRIAEEGALEGVHEIVVALPGGRLTGKVVTGTGGAGKAVVHAQRNRTIIAQQMTDEDGKFDLLGLTPGTYALDAQNETGSTPEPVEVQLEDGETRELQLVTEAYVVLAGYVVRPDARPASGSIVKLSTDGGRLWSRQVADERGYFERRLGARTNVVQLIVLTYEYPAVLVEAHLTGESLRIRIRDDGGIIRFEGDRALISGSGVTAPSHVFHFPEPYGRFDGGVYVQAGTYRVCPATGIDGACRDIIVNNGSDQRVEFGKRKERTDETSVMSGHDRSSVVAAEALAGHRDPTASQQRERTRAVR